MGVMKRIADIRWVDSCFVPGEEVTDDEKCAFCVCCPCYAVALAVSMPVGLVIAMFAMVGVLGAEVGGSIMRVCRGEPNSTKKVRDASNNQRNAH